MVSTLQKGIEREKSQNEARKKETTKKWQKTPKTI